MLRGLTQEIKKWYYLNRPCALEKFVDLLDQNKLELHFGLKISFSNPEIIEEVLQIVALRFNSCLSSSAKCKEID